MNKRILSLALSLLLTLSLLPAARADTPEPTEPVEVELNVYSTETSKSAMQGLYYDNAFYVNKATLREYCGIGSLPDVGRGNLGLSPFSGLRNVYIEPDGTGWELFGTERFTFPCPSVVFEGERYISLLHLLRYLDIPFFFGSGAEDAVHLILVKPYTIYDAAAEYDRSAGYAFTWLEVGETYDSVEEYMKNRALGVLLFRYKAGWTRCMTDAAGVEQDILLDGLTRVIQEEGGDYLDQVSHTANGLNRASAALSLEVSVLDQVTDVIEDLVDQGKMFGSVPALRTVTAAADGIGNGITGLMDAITAVATYSQMTALQSELMKETLLSDQGAFIEKAYPNYYEACRTAQEKIAAAQSGTLARDEALDAIIKVLQQGGTDMAGEALLGPVALGWKVVQNVGSVLNVSSESDYHMMNAMNALVTQEYAVPIAESQLKRVRQNSWFKDGDWQAELRTLQLDIILSLKSALCTREHVRKAEVYGENWRLSSLDEKAASLLRRAEEAVILEPGRKGYATDDDIRWIRELQLDPYGNSCNNLNLGGLAAYSKKEKATIYRGNSSHKVKDGGTTYYTYDLCRRDEDGTVTVLASDASADPCINVLNGWVYYISGPSYGGKVQKLRSTGGDQQTVGYDTRLVYTAYGRLYTLRTSSRDSNQYLYRSKLDGSEPELLATLAVDDMVTGVWITSRHTVYYAKYSMAGGAVGFSAGPSGLFRVTITDPQQEGEKITVTDTQLLEGEFSMFTLAEGRFWYCTNVSARDLSVYDPVDGSVTTVVKDVYYPFLNGDPGDALLVSSYDGIQRVAIGEASVSAPESLRGGSAIKPNLAGDTIYAQDGGSVTHFAFGGTP